MRRTREVLRQIWVLKRKQREVARGLGAGKTTVVDVVNRAREAGLDWNQVEQLDDAALECRLYKRSAGEAGQRVRDDRPLPDFAQLHLERHKVGVTLQLLHQEYIEQQPDGYGYSQFCEYFRRWGQQRAVTMRQVHHAGEKTFVDYSGKRPCIVDRQTGELQPVELFVAVLGASSYTFAEVTRTQTLPDWISSHVRALAYFEGVSAVLVPDQLKSGVTIACRYEPGINRTYLGLAEHYGAVVIPARMGRPRDKAKVEVGVQVAQRWIVARLRNQTFFSIDEMNQRIAELLEELNARPMRVYRASRRELYEQLDRPALKALPPEPFVFADWLRVNPNIDYHVEVEGHYYSVHYGIRHEKRLWARATATTVEIFYNGRRHTSHIRSYARGRHTTKHEHMPPSHQKHLEWTPTRLCAWAAKTGPQTEALVRAILAEREHPEQGYRSCLGIIRLAKRYEAERLEAACSRALTVGARSYRHVASTLEKGLDRELLPTGSAPAGSAPATPAAPAGSAPSRNHENIRGPRYYH